MANDHRTRPTDDDTGKDVIDSTGETIGIVSAVEGDTLHVETDPGLTDSIKATLGWGNTEDTRTIEERHIAGITDDAVRLETDDPGAGTAGAGATAGTGTGAEAGETGTDTGVGRDEDAPVDADEVPPDERNDDLVGGDLSGDETAAEMDDAGDLTTERTTGETGTTEMTDEGVSERETDPAPAEEMGVPTGEDDRKTTDRPPGAADDGGLSTEDEPTPATGNAPGREDVQDAQATESRGEEDVQDPAPDEPRDTEDVRDTAEGLSPDDPEVDPEDQPSTGEAATRGAEEDADLGRDDDEDRSRSS